MDNFLIGNITGSVYLDTRRPKVMDNEIFYPVKARITHNRSRLYVALGFDLTEDDFNKLHRTKSNELIKTKKLITASFERIKSTVEEIHQTEEYSHDKLRNKLKKGRKLCLNAAFENRINELVSSGRVGTANTYIAAQKFIKKYKQDLQFASITPQWLTKFESWALNEEQVSKTTLGMYLRNLRALFNEAIKNGSVRRDAYPFSSQYSNGYKIPDGTGTKIALTGVQINAIAKLDLTGSPERCRDMFLLSYHLGGINFIDMLLLKWKNIRDGEVYYVREKTKRTNLKTKVIVVTLTEPAKRIIERWGNADRSPNAYVIPFLTDDLTPNMIKSKVSSFTSRVNKQLKKIGETLNINGLSTYVARHTAATILKNGGAPTAYISEMQGHTSTKTTENAYFHSFEKEQRETYSKKLANYGG